MAAPLANLREVSGMTLQAGLFHQDIVEGVDPGASVVVAESMAEIDNSKASIK